MMMVKRAGGACVDPICVNVNTADASPSVQPNLILYPQFGAVPPFPDMRSITNNYECSKTGSGVLNSLPTPCTKADGSAATSDLGCKYPEMACGADRSVIFELNGDWTINGNISGHGTLVVSGSLVVNGTFTYYGTIIVNCPDPPTPNCGLVQAGTGNVNVYGGLIAQTTLRLIGNISVNGGTTVSNVPTGNSLVFGKAWWER
ncbi:MAG: polymer-forming cytoskeletal protein [Bacillati bacterium ANGP1]|uniref:Polymer-forming cytoskeletal protein n=1 Tax=Candidatus Segetimicrobium genomatis TaxID=2569760 RepID=A0A537IG24_9BACT|nr:MAG: polymer-forming cytoskeletal protein [Terrabacteria group bacterium ANGP1]